MAVEIEAIRADRIGEYASVPMVCEVHSTLEVLPIDGGVGGLAFHERPVANAYSKNYDAIDGGPLTWAQRFDMTHWGIWLARFDGQTIGGAAIICNPGSTRDHAVLWDIRVRPSHGRQGIGAALFGTASEWARAQGCRSLKIETQNVNATACHFYSKMGCTLAAIDRLAYLHDSRIAREVMLTWCFDL